MRRISTLGLTIISAATVIASLGGGTAFARESEPGDDRGGRHGGHHDSAERGDDHGRRHGGHGADDAVTVKASPTASPDASPTTEAGDDRGRRHGGHGADDARRTSTHRETEPGDDRGGRGRGRGRGSDDLRTSIQQHRERGDDKGGRGRGTDDAPNHG